MTYMKIEYAAVAAMMVCLCFIAPLAQAEPTLRIEHIASEDGASIDVHIFAPTTRATHPRPAMILAHGGGWAAGDATWVYPRAQRFAELGILTVALDYRLNDPRAATADMRAAIRWLRVNAAALNIDPHRIAAYGVSAGGQLAVSAAESDDADARPNALVLLSPALDLERDNWFAHLVGAERVHEMSPITNVRRGMAPVLILQGDVDRETPLPGARRFCAAMHAQHNRCAIKVYRGYGHLFTPAGIDDRETPQPDAAISARAAVYAENWLRHEGFLR